MPRRCGIDTSILVRLATGEPAQDFGRVVAALPGAQLFAPEKFAAEAQAAASGNALGYGCKTGEQLGKLFASHDAIVAVLSLGAMSCSASASTTCAAA